MPWGWEQQERGFLGDTKTLTAFLYDRDNANLIPQADISSVEFTILKPSDDPTTPTVDADPGTVSADGTGTYTVASSVHDEVGDYKAFARFTYDEGSVTNNVRTIPVVYEIADVFQRAGVTPADPAMTIAWSKLESSFDSEHGGPWLRDMTKANFDRNKLRDFVADVLLDLNTQQPQTSYDEASFPWEGDGTAVFGYGLYIATIRHLMRSYTEQPNVMNSSVGYFDRTRYQQAWAAIYQTELPEWERLRELWKRGTLDISRGSLLVGNKAGRLVSANTRARFWGRGYLS